MFRSATNTASYYLMYYTEYAVNWWDNIGLNEYLGILIGVLLLGFWLLKSDPLKTL
ncbi:MAG: hypothetical protein HQ518_26415 [Rhodopirellula sp.]|nr:hypothetical protein [Rhodopirellula sp.]